MCFKSLLGVCAFSKGLMVKYDHVSLTEYSSSYSV